MSTHRFSMPSAVDMVDTIDSKFTQLYKNTL